MAIQRFRVNKNIIMAARHTRFAADDILMLFAYTYFSVLLPTDLWIGYAKLITVMLMCSTIAALHIVEIHWLFYVPRSEI